MLQIEIECAGLRKRIVDVVERVQEDVLLLHPKAALFQKCVTVIIAPRQIFGFERFPNGISLIPRHFRLFVDAMLEIVHHDQIRNRQHGVGQMRSPITRRVIAEEFLHPRIRKVFHRHRVNFADLNRRLPDGGNRQRARSKIRLERMPGLVGEHVNVGGSAVEVRKDERRFQIHQLGLIAAHALAGPRSQVKLLVRHHKIEVFAGLGRELPIHLLRRADHFLLGTVRRRVAFGEEEFFIVIVQLVHADALFLLLTQVRAERNDVLLYALPEPSDVLRAVFIARALQIRQFDIVFHTENLRFVRAERDHLVVNLIQLIRDRSIETCPFAERAFAYRAIRILHEFQKPVEVARLPHIFDLASRGQLCITAAQELIFGIVGNQTLVRQLQARFGVRENDLSERFGKFFAERMMDQNLLCTV